MIYNQTLPIKDLINQYNYNYIKERQFLINLNHRLKQLQNKPKSVIDLIEQFIIDPNTDEDDTNEILRQLYDWSDLNKTLVQ